MRSIIEDDFGQIWIGTYRGIDCCIINSEGEVEWKHYTSYGNTSNALSHHSVIYIKITPAIYGLVHIMEESISLILIERAAIFTKRN